MRSGKASRRVVAQLRRGATTPHERKKRRELWSLFVKHHTSKAAEQLGLHASQLYGWRSKQQQTLSSSEREQSLADENARLKRLLAEQAEELAIVKKAAAYFAKSLK